MKPVISWLILLGATNIVYVIPISFIKLHELILQVFSDVKKSQNKSMDYSVVFSCKGELRYLMVSSDDSPTHIIT